MLQHLILTDHQCKSGILLKEFQFQFVTYLCLSFSQHTTYLQFRATTLYKVVAVGCKLININTNTMMTKKYSIKWQHCQYKRPQSWKIVQCPVWQLHYTRSTFLWVFVLELAVADTKGVRQWCKWDDQWWRSLGQLEKIVLWHKTGSDTCVTHWAPVMKEGTARTMRKLTNMLLAIVPWNL